MMLEAPAIEAGDEGERPTESGMVPNIVIDAYCETDEVAAVWNSAAADRRMSGARIRVTHGGIGSAIEHYRKNRTPELVVVESGAEPAELLPALDALADECLPGTKVVVIGHRNDVSYYRELVGRGVSDYLIAPIEVIGLSAAIARLYAGPGAVAGGRMIAFMGTRGGAGSSVLAHNCAWLMASRFDLKVLVGDADLAFGTAGLDFNLEATRVGVGDALENAKRLDEALLDQLTAKPHERLSVLTSPAALDKFENLSEADLERLVDVAKARPGYTVLDLPHVWTGWVRKVLGAADDIVLVATPDLASLRNTKTMLSYLKQARPNDPAPLLVLNQVGMPRRPEIKSRDFAEATGTELAAIVPFDSPLFGGAANNGKMLDQISGGSPATRTVVRLAEQLAGGKTGGRPRGAGVMARLLGRPKT